MARIRTIKPEFWTSKTLARLSRDSRLVFIGIWTEADDLGILLDSPKLLAGSLFPFDDDVDSKMMNCWLKELEAAGLIFRHSGNNKDFIIITSWDEHQKIDKPSARTLLPRAERDQILENSRNTRESLARLSPPELKERSLEREKEREKEREEKTLAQSDEKSLNASTQQPDVITIPTNTGGEFSITAKHLAEYTALYPAVDVFAQLQAMRAWALSNPRLRKTPGGMLRFVNTWLSKEQNNARASPTRTHGQYQKPRVIESIRNAADDWMAQDAYAGGTTYDA